MKLRSRERPIVAEAEAMPFGITPTEQAARAERLRKEAFFRTLMEGVMPASPPLVEPNQARIPSASKQEASASTGGVEYPTAPLSSH